jgi:hypothetical protein
MWVARIGNDGFLFSEQRREIRSAAARVVICLQLGKLTLSPENHFRTLRVERDDVRRGTEEPAMNRFAGTTFLMLAASCGMAAESEDVKDRQSVIGEWTRTCSEGTVTLSISDTTLTLTGEQPGAYVTVLRCPGYVNCAEGLVFGYFNEVSYTRGAEAATHSQVLPFAFRASVENDVLKISEVRIYGLDVEGHKRFRGDFRSASEQNVTSDKQQPQGQSSRDHDSPAGTWKVSQFGTDFTLSVSGKAVVLTMDKHDLEGTVEYRCSQYSRSSEGVVFGCFHESAAFEKPFGKPRPPKSAFVPFAFRLTDKDGRPTIKELR